MRIVVILVVCSSLLGVSVATGSLKVFGERRPVGARVGSVAPDFQLADTAGRPWQLRSLKGQPVLLAFVCGCAACGEMLAEVGRRPLPRGRLLVISSLPIAQIDELIAPSQGHFPGLFDPFSKTAITYASTRCPRVWVLDSDQVISYASSADPPATRELVEEASRMIRG